jgi:hypothetical protein
MANECYIAAENTGTPDADKIEFFCDGECIMDMTDDVSGAPNDTYIIGADAAAHNIEFYTNGTKIMELIGEGVGGGEASILALQPSANTQMKFTADNELVLMLDAV